MEINICPQQYGKFAFFASRPVPAVALIGIYAVWSTSVLLQVGIYWTYAAFAAACAYFSFITPQIWRTFGQG